MHSLKDREAITDAKPENSENIVFLRYIAPFWIYFKFYLASKNKFASITDSETFFTEEPPHRV